MTIPGPPRCGPGIDRAPTRANMEITTGISGAQFAQIVEAGPDREKDGVRAVKRTKTGNLGICALQPEIANAIRRQLLPIGREFSPSTRDLCCCVPLLQTRSRLPTIPDEPKPLRRI